MRDHARRLAALEARMSVAGTSRPLTHEDWILHALRDAVCVSYWFGSPSLTGWDRLLNGIASAHADSDCRQATRATLGRRFDWAAYHVGRRATGRLHASEREAFSAIPKDERRTIFEAVRDLSETCPELLTYSSSGDYQRSYASHHVTREGKLMRMGGGEITEALPAFGVAAAADFYGDKWEGAHA